MKDVPANNKGLKKLPTEVRNKMGYKAKGGMAAKKMASGGRTVSSTDASTAKSTPPKTGKDATRQRVVNSLTKLIGTDGLKGLTAVTKEAKERAKKLKGPPIDPSIIKPAPKEYKRPPSGKAYGGKTKMMAGGRAKKK